jgi:hypothetical protein
MTREEMLKQMGLTHEELKDLLHKLRQLHASLNEHQRAVLTRSLPTPSRAAKTFGADVTAEDLEKFLRTEDNVGFNGGCVVAVQGHNR